MSDDKDRFALLQKAVRTHVNNSDKCRKGFGVDRHLYALHRLALQNAPNRDSLPDLFRDSAYSKVFFSLYLLTYYCFNIISMYLKKFFFFLF